MLHASVVVVTVALLASPAIAGPRHSLGMVRVALDDLDLSSRSGAAAMLRRLDAAARDLCAFERSALFPAAQGRAWRCRREAVAAAVARLTTPALQVAYADWLSADPTAEPPSPRHR